MSDAAGDPRRQESALPPEAMTLAAVLNGEVGMADLAIRRTTLQHQAEIAASNGYAQLARNFRRAAELTSIPNPVLLETYEKLRPYRATYHQLLAAAQEIAARYDAPETGAYIREAAEALSAKGLLKQDQD